MIKVSVLYPLVEGMHFDMAYYLGQHLPLVQRLVGDALLRYEVDEGLSGAAPGSLPTYRAAVHMYFASTESFYTAFSPHGKEIMKDVANYTDARPLTQISDVIGSY